MSDREATDDDKLAAEIRAALPRPSRVPREVDVAILSQARRELASPRSRSRRRFLRRVVVAAAAAVILTGVVFWFRGTESEPATSLVAVDPRDLDRSGQIDIVDAYLLAVRVAAGEFVDAKGAGPDVTGDGEIDGRDVNALALASVRLGNLR